MPRTCTICTHPQREDIDAALVAGQESARRIAALFRVSDDAITRHRAHIPPALARAQAATEVARADTLLDQVRSLQTRTLDILSKAERAGDLRTAVSAIGQARGNLELLAKLVGELNETTVNVALIASPEWTAVRAAVLRAVEPYPDARLALAEALSHAGG
jgi:hypothetical protein